MDAFVHCKKRLEEPLTTLSSANYNAAVLASRG
jgi:hypothetical protein